MRRRTVLSVAMGSAVSIAGCGGVNTQPESVPVCVNNQASQQLDVGVEVREAGESEPLVTTTVTVDQGEEESVYAKPIQEDRDYVVSIIVDGNSTEQSIFGGGLRNVLVTVHSRGRVEIRRVDT